MAKINLLPWREEKRKELLNEFLVMLGFVALLAVITIGVVHFYHSQLIEMQKGRISFINRHIEN